MLTHIKQPFDGLFVRGSSMLERLHVTVIEWSANETRNLIKNSELDKGSIDRGLSFIIKDFACSNGKTTKIRRTAVRETGVSRQNGGQVGAPLKPFERHTTMLSRGLRGLSIGPPLCQEVQASQTTKIFFYLVCTENIFFI